MENRYYTPNIEEFYIGFEYEFYNSYSNQWTRHECDFDDFGFDEQGPIDEESTVLPDSRYEGRLRVKYLDEQDVQDLGFRLVAVGEECKDGKIFKIDVFEYGEYSPTNDYTRVSFTDSGATIIESNVNWIGDPSFISAVFMGYIKNKSELHKILKQVRVIE